MAMQATNATYQAYEKLLFKAVYGAMGKWGGTFDDYLSDANDIFVYACGRYTEGRGKFTTYLTFLLNHLMVERVRSELKRKERLPTEPVEVIPDVALSSRMYEIPEQLSEDARHVIELVLDMPADVKLCLVQLDKYPEDAEQEVKYGKAIATSMKEFLQDLGWSLGRIDKTFKEIKESL